MKEKTNVNENYISREELENTYNYQKKVFDSKIEDVYGEIEKLQEYFSVKFGEDIKETKYDKEIYNIQKEIRNLQKEYQNEIKKIDEQVKGKGIDEKYQKAEELIKQKIENVSNIIGQVISEQEKKLRNLQASQEKEIMQLLELVKKNDEEIRDKNDQYLSEVPARIEELIAHEKSKTTVAKLEKKLTTLIQHEIDDLNYEETIGKIRVALEKLTLSFEDFQEGRKQVISQSDTKIQNLENYLRKDFAEIEENLQKIIRNDYNKLNDKSISLESRLTNELEKKLNQEKYEEQIQETQIVINNLQNDVKRRVKQEQYEEQIQTINDLINSLQNNLEEKLNKEEYSSEIQEVQRILDELKHDLKKKLYQEEYEEQIKKINNLIESLQNNLEEKLNKDEYDGQLEETKNEIDTLKQDLEQKLNKEEYDGQLEETKNEIDTLKQYLKQKLNKEQYDKQLQETQNLIETIEQVLKKQISKKFDKQEYEQKSQIISNSIDELRKEIQRIEEDKKNAVVQSEQKVEELVNKLEKQNYKAEIDENVKSIEELKLAIDELQNAEIEIQQENNDKFEKLGQTFENRMDSIEENNNKRIDEIKNRDESKWDNISKELEKVQSMQSKFNNDVNTVRNEHKKYLEQQENKNFEYKKNIDIINQQTQNVLRKILEFEQKNKRAQADNAKFISERFEAIDPTEDVKNIKKELVSLQEQIGKIDKIIECDIEKMVDKKIKALKKEYDKTLNNRLNEFESMLKMQQKQQKSVESKSTLKREQTNKKDVKEEKIKNNNVITFEVPEPKSRTNSKIYNPIDMEVKEAAHSNIIDEDTRKYSLDDAIKTLMGTRKVNNTMKNDNINIVQQEIEPVKKVRKTQILNFLDEDM